MHQSGRHDNNCDQRHIWQTLLFPVALLASLKEKLLAVFGNGAKSVDVGNAGPLVSAVLRRLLEAEAWTAPRATWPFGLWIFCVASRTKP
jgi:hypothetical protein